MRVAIRYNVTTTKWHVNFRGWFFFGILITSLLRICDRVDNTSSAADRVICAYRQGQQESVALPWNVERLSWYCHPSHPYKMRKTRWFQHNLHNFLRHIPRSLYCAGGMVFAKTILHRHCGASRLARDFRSVSTLSNAYPLCKIFCGRPWIGYIIYAVFWAPPIYL